MRKIMKAFCDGLNKIATPQCRKDKSLRDRMSEDQLDCMIDDSFPASDPPSTY